MLNFKRNTSALKLVNYKILCPLLGLARASVAEAFVILRAGLEFALTLIAAGSGGRFDCGFRLVMAGAYWIKRGHG
jgi:hypothetical protein